MIDELSYHLFKVYWDLYCVPRNTLSQTDFSSFLGWAEKVHVKNVYDWTNKTGPKISSCTMLLMLLRLLRLLLMLLLLMLLLKLLRTWMLLTTLMLLPPLMSLLALMLLMFFSFLLLLLFSTNPSCLLCFRTQFEKNWILSKESVHSTQDGWDFDFSAKRFFLKNNSNILFSSHLWFRTKLSKRKLVILYSSFDLLGVSRLEKEKNAQLAEKLLNPNKPN